MNEDPNARTKSADSRREILIALDQIFFALDQQMIKSRRAMFAVRKTATAFAGGMTAIDEKSYNIDPKQPVGGKFKT